MTRPFNFSAGPAVMPVEVLEQAAREMLDWNGTGMSVMEMSHRGKAFVSICEQAEADLRELLAVPETHHILFLHGGATPHFAMVPLNLAQPGQSADYIHTGYWSDKAMAEATSLVNVRIAASAAASEFDRVPERAGWQLGECFVSRGKHGEWALALQCFVQTSGLLCGHQSLE